MNLRISAGLCMIVGAASLFIAATDSLGEPPGKSGDSADQIKLGKPIMTIAEARARTKLLHTTYESTLIMVHRAYFEEGKRLTVPSRVLEDVFYWVDQETNGKTRWISVNTEAMNIDHEPESEFEKRAAKALASGKDDFELIEKGVYHRAGAVTLVASCLRCHEPTLMQNRRRKRVVGLVISIPVKQD
ncbi:MAG: hypothetical protein QGH33_16515 [Pirellulaceae bacterium]|nr:hypothetical protein [Pirellulaceae bacterium]